MYFMLLCLDVQHFISCHTQHRIVSGLVNNVLCLLGICKCCLHVFTTKRLYLFHDPIACLIKCLGLWTGYLTLDFLLLARQLALLRKTRDHQFSCLNFEVLQLSYSLCVQRKAGNCNYIGIKKPVSLVKVIYRYFLSYSI